jgi:ABC-type sugar transport system substrate-binding protein|nr:sugar ABC transporter substrate-binding protein [Panacagrimonas sp.]
MVIGITSLITACDPGTRNAVEPPTGAAAAAVKTPDLSGGDSSAMLRTRVDTALKGKVIAWVPVALGMPLTEIWTQVMRAEAEARGMKLEVRDPNWNTTAGLQAVSSLISERPDVLVVHNPNVQLYARELARAEAAGIVVIQVNMVSNHKTSAYVGANWKTVGRLLGEEIVRACGTGSGTSGKVAIVQGEATSGTSIEQAQGATEVLATDKGIRIVSNQAANWDASKAHDITATVLQQHPDLCATVGFWGVMQAGAAQAVKSAGLQGKVRVYSSGGDGKLDCDNVDSGLFTKFLTYDAPSQAKVIVQFASFMLQTGLPPSSVRAADYSRLQWMEKGKYDPGLCYDPARRGAARS